MPSMHQKIVYSVYGSPIPVWVVVDAKGDKEEFSNYSDAYGRFLALTSGGK